MKATDAGIDFRVQKGPISKLPTDFIVRSTTPMLDVAEAFHRFAGPELRKYCGELVEANRGAFSEGVGIVTPGFGLKARFVYHMVVPTCQIQGAPTPDEVMALHRSVLACFFAAQSRGCTSLAMPYLGIFEGFPNESVCQAYLQAALNFDRTMEGAIIDRSLHTVLIHSPYDEMNTLFFSHLKKQTYLKESEIEGHK